MSTEPFLSSRRELLAGTAFGVGAIALAQLLRSDGALADIAKKPGENLSLDLKARAPHFAPKAKAMISLFMHGGPSHVDLLDPKPELSKRNGIEYDGEVVFSFVNRASKKLFGSPWKFAKHGQCGTSVSELLPDSLCLIVPTDYDSPARAFQPAILRCANPTIMGSHRWEGWDGSVRGEGRVLRIHSPHPRG